MKFKTLLITFLASVIASSAHATVTLVFDGSFYTGLISGLANAAGTPTNNMRWGIIVSTSDATFSGSGLSYDAYAAGPTTAGFLSYAGSVSDDYFIPGGLTTDTSGDSEGIGGTTGGAGGIIDNITGIALTGDLAGLGLGAGITQGDKFALVWFSGNSSTAGSKYGFLTDSLFTIPASGQDNDAYLANFMGTDSPRIASNTFASVAPVPEPSRALLLGFGAVGLMFRRRRA